MFCEKCGSKLPENAKFCAGCGAKAELAQPIASQPQAQYTPPATTYHRLRRCRNLHLKCERMRPLPLTARRSRNRKSSA